MNFGSVETLGNVQFLKVTPHNEVNAVTLPVGVNFLEHGLRPFDFDPVKIFRLFIRQFPIPVGIEVFIVRAGTDFLHFDANPFDCSKHFKSLSETAILAVKIRRDP